MKLTIPLKMEDDEDIEAGIHIPLGQPYIPEQVERIWHDLFDESQEQLPGQCAERKLVHSFKNERGHGLRHETRAAMATAGFQTLRRAQPETANSALGYKSPMQFSGRLGMRNWQYEKRPLEDEKPREAQTPIP